MVLKRARCRRIGERGAGRHAQPRAKDFEILIVVLCVRAEDGLLVEHLLESCLVELDLELDVDPPLVMVAADGMLEGPMPTPSS